MNGRFDFEHTSHYRVVCLLLLCWWFAFVFNSLSFSDNPTELKNAAASTEEGSLANQVFLVTFAGLGIIHFQRAKQALRSRRAHVLMALLLLYFGWSLASVLWSEDPQLTIRRLIILLLLATGAFGIGAGFYSRVDDPARTLGRHVIYAAILAAVMLLLNRLQNVTLADMLNPKFNLKETTRIAQWSFVVGYAVIGALIVFETRAIRRWATLVIAMIVLAVLKGRSLIGDIVAASMVVQSRLVPRRGWRIGLMIGGLLLMLLVADLATGGTWFVKHTIADSDQIASVLPWVSIGDGMKNLTTLSGRLPLWQALYEYIGERPIQGYGFGAFWSPSRFDEIYARAGWRAVVGHNGFLDELLATGAIGLALFLAFWFYGMWIAVNDARESSSRVGYLVFGWMLMFILFNALESLFQSYFQFPVFASMTGLFLMMDRCGEQRGAEWMEAQLAGTQFMIETSPAEIR